MSTPGSLPNRLVDYFVVCGLDFTSGLEPDHLSGEVLADVTPLERSYKGKVLEHYPSNVPWNEFDCNAVCILCLPHGLQFKTQKHDLEPIFHSFVITKEDRSRYYGFSLVFYEEVRNRKICNAMQILQEMHLTELASKQLRTEQSHCRSLPRHFKLSAHQPRAAQNYYDSTKDTLYVSKTIALIMQLPYVAVSYKFLVALHRYALSKPASPDQLSVESHIYNLLFEVPVPQPGRSVEVHIVNTGEALILQRPITIEELPLLDFSLSDLFVLLSVDTVIQVFTCILLEYQVLICSSDFERLMLVAECLTSLLFPFTWQHVYVPILPASLQHFLDAPVPYIMGLHSSAPQAKSACESNVCYLNIDEEVVQLPEEVPDLPMHTELSTDLAVLLDRFAVNPPTRDVLLVPEIMSLSAYMEGDMLPENVSRRKHSWAHDSDTTESALMKVVDIARRTGVSVEGVSPPAAENELKFKNAVRETFVHRFVTMFSTYDRFVIMPTEADKDEWFSNRESMQNFDKATFLSDQPTHHLPFLSQFLETQMFASLIDAKILASFGEVDSNLRVFDKRIKNSRKRSNREDGAVEGLEKEDSCQMAIRASQLLIEKRLASVDLKVPEAQEVLDRPSDHFKLARPPRGFPALDAVALSNPSSKRYHRTGSQWNHRKHRSGSSSLPRPGSNRTVLHSTNSTKCNKESHVDQSPAKIAQANWNFVERLLKDCKLKTNRMVVEKMGAEGVLLGKEQLGHVEENTLIASLCDLLEKVWSHGIQNKLGKSALWAHLLRFQETGDGNDNVKPMDQAEVTPDISTLALELDPSPRSQSQGSVLTGEGSPSGTPDCRSLDRRSLDRRSLNQDCCKLPVLPASVSFDIQNVQAMSEIKSQIGFARAWIRLSLEKKLLSRHLQTLLSDMTLLRSQYKRNAFLRCEEEREQFVFHLLSLNAVDYHCFTNTYLSTKLPYRVVIFPSRRAGVSSTTANVWVAISGTHCDTTQVAVPRGTLDFLFHHKNLGLLTTLRIGHDNMGLSPNWMVDTILVRCEVTGHTFRFPCGRYLGKSVDDGSTERLLVGEAVMARTEGSPNDQPSARLSCRSPAAVRKETRLSIAEIEHMIGDSVNNIVKYFHRRQSSRQGSYSGLTPLLCGEMGLVNSLEQAFLLGFKASRIFGLGRNFYLWDFFLRVKEQFDSLVYNPERERNSGSLDRRQHQNIYNNNYNRTDGRNSPWGRTEEHIPRAAGSIHTTLVDRRLSATRTSSSRDYGNERNPTRRSLSGATNAQLMRSYCNLVSKIESSSQAVGKDGKFQRFVCLAIRFHLLDKVLPTLASSRPTREMYEDTSFLRNANLRAFLIEILQSLDDYDFILESSITSGIDNCES